MRLSVIIPAYNEIKTIREIIKRVKNVDLSKEIIIVDDGSKDGTRDFLKKLEDPEIKVFFNKKNYGKSHSVRVGIREAEGDIIIIQDADLEYNPNDYYKLVQPIISGKTKVVYGTRFPKNKGHPSLFHSYMPLINPYYFANKILTILSNILYNADITDEPTCYKVFDTKVLKNLNLKSERFEFCPEVTAKVKKKGYKIHEIPISYYPRTTKEGKKINWKDGFEAIWTLIKYRFHD
jgi:glycosyltransferase involved in cell wall biosynthesis